MHQPLDREKKLKKYYLNASHFLTDTLELIRLISQGSRQKFMPVSFLRYLVVLLLIAIVFCGAVAAEKSDKASPTPTPLVNSVPSSLDPDDGPMGYVESESDGVPNVSDSDISPGETESDSAEAGED